MLASIDLHQARSSCHSCVHSFLCVWVLDHNQQKVLVRRDQNLVLFRSDAKEAQVVAGVERADDAACFGSQLRQQRGVFGRLLGSQRGLQNLTLCVDDENALHPTVALQAPDRFFHLALRT